MNRLTAIGLASLVAYALLIASKYTGVVSAAREDRPIQAARPAATETAPSTALEPLAADPRPSPVDLPAPIARTEPTRLSPAALEFRAARDLKAYADALLARRASLNADERYHLARALEECQFATTINEDLAAYEAVDNTQRCIGFQNAKISAKDIEDLYRAAAQQGDPRAQARMLTADLNRNLSGAARGNASSEVQGQTARVQSDDLSRLIGLLESRDPEALLIVGQFLASSSMATQLRVGPNGEVPEPSAFLGGFSLVACDLGQDCSQMNREPLMACAYAGYCNAQSFEELYQNFLASPWAYTQAIRYRQLIHTAIDTRNWALIGLVPKKAPQQGSQ